MIMADDKRQPDLPAPPKGAHIPPAAHVPGQEYQPRPRAAGEGDPSAEANARVASDIAGQANRPIPANQLVTEPTDGPLVGGRAMWVTVGPYKGSVLTMPDAEAEDAKDSHWAINMSDMQPPFDANAPLEHDHELTDEDRAYAVEAANAWAAAQNPPPDDHEHEHEDEAAPEGETEAQKHEREKRNADRKAQRERKPQAGQQPAGQPPQKPGRAVNPKPGAPYETRRI
jgi:hypothetical protein